ncbi:MAG: hypothetical protein PHE79_07665 [Eubacteriales bacterium]|nr:hypothetical protein [Eubacteriales bacterium]
MPRRTNQVYKELINHLIEKHFLRSIRFSKRMMLELIQKENWQEKISVIIAKETVACQDVLKICETTMNSLSDAPENGWLPYTYDYILNRIFPEDVPDKTIPACEAGMLFYLEVMRMFLRYETENKVFDKRIHLEFLTPHEIDKVESADEYNHLIQLFKENYIYEFMRIGQEITKYKTLSHVSGVHYISLHIGRQLLQAGIPIDLALVSGAAIGHDIGKYGCKPEEAKRIPYLHYYYTDKYFKKNGMPAIGHIASNHSTWDLELENLSVESLVLIYSDFRVKSINGKKGDEFVQFYDLKDSFGVILNKLDNVDEAKKDRYIKVYNKLKDFEDYMLDLGVNTDLTSTELRTRESKDPALYNSDEAVQSLKNLAIQHNIGVMNKLNSETAFGDVLEAARSEGDWKNIRAYMNIFAEYFTYMTQKQKVMTLNFLYELLMHREGDIRRQSAQLIGNIIVHYDEEYRKELPRGVIREPDEITSIRLWEKYLEAIIFPDHKVTDQHKRWLGYTIKFVLQSVLERCKKEDCRNYFESFLHFYINATEVIDSTAFILLDSILDLPLSLFTDEDIRIIMDFITRMASRDSLEIQIAVLRIIKYLSASKNHRRQAEILVKSCMKYFNSDEVISMKYLKHEILKNLKLPMRDEKGIVYAIYQDPNTISEIFFENLKYATPWVLKVVNIEILMDHIHLKANKQLLQVATHFSNLLKVSDRVIVRHTAGQALLSIIPKLSLAERNEIAVELSKSLEIGQYEFSKYLPDYLGVLALHLHPNELDELIHNFRRLLNSTNEYVGSVTLNTLGIMLQNYSQYKDRFHESNDTYTRRRDEILGLIMKGLSNYNDIISQEAFLVIGQFLFGSSKLTLDDKYAFFKIIYKRMLILIMDQRETELSFFSRAASLNHIYRFLSDYLFLNNELNIPVIMKVAFFPGTFDPFSLGHKGIVKEIRNLGYEIYLAIDEFSWSKKTQPRLVRRKIISMSEADEKDVYLFPDDIPINLANPKDLKKLRDLFPEREIYIVVGSDVIEKASSYKAPPEENSIHGFHHIIFRRTLDVQNQKSKMESTSILTGKLIELKLPPYLEEISSTQIRENVDYNRDISQLIEPLTESYVYDNSLYLREPQYKHIFGTRQIKFEIIKKFSGQLIDELTRTLFQEQHNKEHIRSYLERNDVKAVIIRDGSRNDIPVAIAAFHEVSMSDLFSEFGNIKLASHIRGITSGRIVVLSGIAYSSDSSIENTDQLVLTEALAYCLENGFTFAIYHRYIGEIDTRLARLLNRQGFQLMKVNEAEDHIYAVDMKYPVTLQKDISTIVKEPFNGRERVLNAIEEAHKKMQHSLTKLYPGNLVLSFDAKVMHYRIVDLITQNNNVPSEPLKVRQLGEFMCVPFGKILRGMVVPNTVTKSLHTDKRFEPAITRFEITEFPNYSPLTYQIRTIKSFQRPVLLVDDLLHKGYRLRKLDPLFRQENLQVSKIIVGLLSGRGKDLMTLQNREVESVYFIPNLRSWFVESNMYPFIGGDSVLREGQYNKGFLPSINLILPYVAPNFLMDTPKLALYDFSMTCLTNARSILKTIEEEYQIVYERKLTLNRQGEALLSTRYPDKGGDLSYDINMAPSEYISSDIEMLKRLENIILR